MRSNSL
jgi:RNA polymerase II subunit A-like phosphatase